MIASIQLLFFSTTAALGALSILVKPLGGNAFLFNECMIKSTTPTTVFTSFDFASPAEWDRFYQRIEKNDKENTVTKIATEWHSSVPLDDIASTIPSNGTCLLIGCGNSYLPDRILQRDAPPRSLALLDTSQACLDQLRDRFQITISAVDGSDSIDGNTATCGTKVEYICGDATQLSKYFVTDDENDERHNRTSERMTDENQCAQNNVSKESVLFDIIIDKGLTDAILCGEGWDGPLEKLLYESAKVLSLGTGRYLLISYSLPSSTKEFLVTAGKTVGLEWEFDFDLPSGTLSSEESNRKPNERVSIAMAKRNHKVVR